MSVDRHYFTMFEPELRENEICNWVIGSDVPHIVTVRGR